MLCVDMMPAFSFSGEHAGSPLRISRSHSVMKKIFFLIILFATKMAFAETLTLEHVLAAVKESHPSITQAKWDAEATRQMKKSQSWLEDPEVSLMFEEVGPTNSSLGNADMTNYSVSQKIPFPGKLITKSKALGSEYKAKTAVITSRQLDVEFEAKKTYYEIIANQNLLNAKSSSATYYGKMATSLTKDYETKSDLKDKTIMMGSSNLSDVFMAKMKKAEIETEIHDLHHQRQALVAKLNLLMGRDPETKTTLVAPKTKYLKINLKTLEQKILTQNPSLKAMDFLVKKAKSEVSLAKQDYIPDLQPELTYNQRQNRENSYSLSFNFNVPLWLNRKSAEVKQAKAQELRDNAEYNVQKLNAKTDLYYLYNHAKWHSQALRKFQGEVLPLARSAINTGLTDYGLNQTNAPGLLQKIINYEDASSMYWKMWVDYMTEYALLEKLTGENL